MRYQCQHGLVLAALLAGCDANVSELQAPAQSEYVSTAVLTGIDDLPVGDRFDKAQTGGGEMNVLRLEVAPQSELPATLKERPVQPAGEWEFGLWIGEELVDGTPPQFSCQFSKYPDSLRVAPPDPATATLTSESGQQITSHVEFVLPPEDRLPSHVYRYAQIPMGIPTGTYRAQVLLFPTADPLPDGNLMMGARVLGQPVVLTEFELVISRSQ